MWTLHQFPFRNDELWSHWMLLRKARQCLSCSPFQPSHSIIFCQFWTKAKIDKPIYMKTPAIFHLGIGTGRNKHWVVGQTLTATQNETPVRHPLTWSRLKYALGSTKFSCIRQSHITHVRKTMLDQLGLLKIPATYVSTMKPVACMCPLNIRNNCVNGGAERSLSVTICSTKLSVNHHVIDSHWYIVGALSLQYKHLYSNIYLAAEFISVGGACPLPAENRATTQPRHVTNCSPWEIPVQVHPPNMRIFAAHSMTIYCLKRIRI